MSGIDELMQRIRLGEDSTLELKRVVLRSASKVSDPHPDSMSDELAAMANAAGGTLVLGIDDKTRDVLGIPVPQLDAVEQWLGAICRDRITPPLDVLTRHIELPDSTGAMQPVITVAVPRSLWVHKSAGGYFKRVGHAKREMAPDMLARLFQQRSQARLIRFEEQPVPETSIADLDPLLARVFVRDGEGEPEAQLKRLHLLVKDGDTLNMSVAGALLATTKPVRWLPAAYVQAVAYRGVNNDPVEQLDAKDFDGPIGQQVWDAYGFVQRNMGVGADKNLGRVDRPQYSLRAVFEAIVNAVAHRDYSMSNARIRLHLFHDRLELSSPGALPNSLSIESMSEVSVPRNELITSLFSRYHAMREGGLGREFLMDRRGAGVDIILRESLKLSGRRPVYENLSDVELRLTIFAAADQGNSEK
jgi:ATP-dependent DNA helicase RecG